MSETTDVGPEEAVLEAIVDRIVRLIADVRKRQGELTQKHGVTLLQYTAIHTLREAGPINITQLADRLHLNQSTVSSLVDRMERNALVRRVQSSVDRRAVKLRLTEKADDIAEKFSISPLEFFKVLLKSLSPEDRSTLAEIMVKLEKNFTQRLTQIGSLQDLVQAGRKKRTTG